MIPFTVKKQILTHKAVPVLPLWLFTARSEQQFNFVFNSQFLIGKLSTVALCSERANHRSTQQGLPRTSCKPQAQSEGRCGDVGGTPRRAEGIPAPLQPCRVSLPAGETCCSRGRCAFVRITQQQASTSYRFPKTEPWTL